MHAFISQLNPYLQHEFVIGAYEDFGAWLYPAMCDFASVTALKLLKRAFGKALLIKLKSGMRYGTAHHWLEMELDLGRFYLSFSEGQFLFAENLDLVMHLDTHNVMEFALLYTTLGYSRFVLQKLDDGFYERYGLALDSSPRPRHRPQALERFLKNLTKRMQNQFQLPPHYEDSKYAMEMKALTLQEIVQAFVCIAGMESLTEFDLPAVPYLEAIANDQRWPEQKRRRATAARIYIQYPHRSS